MARKKVQRDEPSGDEWLATYSDCVTLLMTFFVLLYAMSSTDEAKMSSRPWPLPERARPSPSRRRRVRPGPAR